VVVRRSIGLPLALGIVLAILVLVLAVGWQILVVGNSQVMAPGLRTRDWMLLILGTALFALVLAGLVWLSAWLIREMRLNQLQRAFLDAVTHEMKTPLASLRLYLETLSRHDPAPERRRAFLERMQEDVRRLEHTVGQVLSATRAELRSRAPAEVLELSALLHSAVIEVRERHGLSEDAVRLLPGPPAAVLGNRAELQVVFRNLLENAVKYSDDPVHVHVRVARKGDDRVDVAISDRGIGIPPRELRKIFQRFYRAGRDVQRTASGLGLGLFIVRNLVRRQGGRVVARSEGSGAGSRFVVTLRTTPHGRAEGRAPRAGALEARREGA
jgi:signal transduction histidine kinase